MLFENSSPETKRKARAILYTVVVTVAAGMLWWAGQPAPAPATWRTPDGEIYGYMRCFPGKPRAEWDIKANPTHPAEVQAATMAHENVHADNAERRGCYWYNATYIIPWVALPDEARARCTDIEHDMETGKPYPEAFQLAVDDILMGASYPQVAILGERRIAAAIERTCGHLKGSQRE